MMRSLFSSVAGLKNHQTRMDVIGNNIANVNTTGYKASRVTFQDMLSQTITGAASANGTRGGMNPKQIGLGMGMASIDTMFTDGSVQSTGKNTDLCISGAGFFVLGDGDNTYYTRSGAFEFDSAGNYVVPGSGLRVQGWMADSTGKINANSGITDIVVPVGQSMAATATTKATFSKNLSAGAVTSGLTKTQAESGLTAADVTAIDALAAGASYTTGNTTVLYDGTNYTKIVSNDAVTSFAAYDSEGIKHMVTGTFKKTATNTWTFTPSAKTDTGCAITGSYTIAFNSDGSYNAAGTSGTSIKFSPSTIGLGGDPVDVKLDFSSVTQYDGDTTVAVDKDGNTSGSLESVSTDSTGTIVGSFSNGLKRNLAQVALATFNNPGGLTKSGTSLYSESNNSGAAQVNKAGTGGAGKLTPSSLEMSNVDLSEEFSNMIVTQRGFQANSKIITVSDEMIETLVNLKR